MARRTASKLDQRYPAPKSLQESYPLGLMYNKIKCHLTKYLMVLTSIENVLITSLWRRMTTIDFISSIGNLHFPNVTHTIPGISSTAVNFPLINWLLKSKQEMVHEFDTPYLWRSDPCSTNVKRSLNEKWDNPDALRYNSWWRKSSYR